MVSVDGGAEIAKRTGTCAENKKDKQTAIVSEDPRNK